MQTVCVQCTNTPQAPAPHSPLKKKNKIKVEKKEETMTISVTENTFRSYIQLNKINGTVSILD